MSQYRQYTYLAFYTVHCLHRCQCKIKWMVSIARFGTIECDDYFTEHYTVIIDYSCFGVIQIFTLLLQITHLWKDFMHSN